MNPLINIQRTNTILYCRNWAETVRFYKEKVRLPVILEKDWFVEFLQTASSYLSVADSTRSSISDVQGGGITITWQVADIAQAKEKFEVLGIQTTAVQYKWNAAVFYCRDPEGHRIEIWQPGSLGEIS